MLAFSEKIMYNTSIVFAEGSAQLMNSTSSIITIGREYGSGGRQIGQEIAKYFGIKCYDKELLEHAANDRGIC